MSVRQALVFVTCVWLLSHRRQRKFLKRMRFLVASGLFRPPVRAPRCPVTPSCFSPSLDNHTARERYRFTIPQLTQLAQTFKLGEWIVVPRHRDRLTSLEALAILCRRLSEPSKLMTVASEFGRSPASLSRIFTHMVCVLYERFKDILYLNRQLIAKRMDLYCRVVHERAPMATCWGFIDGTKHYICRPSARTNSSEHENLQRSVYNGHPRRHCLNWQGITTPDGIIVSMYGPIEGRRHDSTVLIMSGLLGVFSADTDVFGGKYIYGDPAYGCCEHIVCPFPFTQSGTPRARFNAAMSSVRESVEWSFGRLKSLWGYIAYDKKQKVRQAAIGKQFFVATLLTNCHSCLQPRGNQVSMYFGVPPPTLAEYLNTPRYNE